MRLNDHDLTVLTDAAAKGATETRAMFGGPRWDDMELARQNEVREEALPYIVAGSRALADIGYRKPRTITTVEELDALPIGSVVREPDTGMHLVWVKYTEDVWCIPVDDTSYSSAEVRTPVTVLHEPEATK